MTLIDDALPVALYTADQVRELDRVAIEEAGIPGGVLMERAGTAAFSALRRRWPAARRLAVVCGGGNNAGDGYVLARQARHAGFQVTVYALKPTASLQGDARGAADAYLEVGGVVADFAGTLDAGAEVVVDSVFGTGLARPPEGLWRDAIRAIDTCGRPVLAVDVPSGLDADTGVALGDAVHADATITFIGLKCGLFTGAGPELAGGVQWDDLQVPVWIYDAVPARARRITQDHVRGCLPRRQRSAHKGQFGHVLVVGGDQGMAGAARLAAEAAARVGAGLTTIATREAHAPLVAATRPELMAHGVESSRALAPLLERATVVAVGPGLGRSDWGRCMLARVLESGHPMVVDADALNLLAAEPVDSDRWILTPHPGEAGRLLRMDPAEVEGDRFGAVTRLAAQYGGVAVLKGAGSLVAGGDHPVAVGTVGNPGMAVGGMGDVLTGVVAGLLAQGLTLRDAAECGVYVHGAAGDRAAARGERGLLPGELMEQLRPLVNPVPR